MKELIMARGCGKPRLQLFNLLEQLKLNSKTEEERLYFEEIQKEWSEFCVGSTWRVLGLK